MITRELRITRNVCKQLDEISDYLGIHKKTLASISISHGIDYVNNGFYPKYFEKEDINNSPKERLKIILPLDVWNIFDSIHQKYKLPEWKLFDIFINIEINKYTAIIKKFDICNGCGEEDDEAPESLQNVISPDDIRLTFNSNISPILISELEQKFKFLGINRAQMLRYLLINGIIEEGKPITSDSLKYDKELLQMIDDLKLNRGKALTLIAYVLESKPRF